VAAWRHVGPRAGELHALRHEAGHAWVGRLPLALGAPSDAEGRSPLVLLEDGRPLGPAHAMLQEVQVAGAGRYYHWYRHVVFATSDNSSPLTNGRRYTVEVAP
jgi:pectate lyase